MSSSPRKPPTSAAPSVVLLVVVVVAFSVLFVWGPARGVFETIGRLASTQQVGFEVIAFVGQLFFVVVGSFPGFLGLLAIFGRCRVDWRERRLSTAECLGPIRWRRRMPREPIRKFKVDFGRDTENNKPVTDGLFARFGVLIAEFEQSKPRIVVLGYPRDWLQAWLRICPSASAPPPLSLTLQRLRW